MIIDKWNKQVDSDSMVIDSSILFKNGEKWEVPDKEEFYAYLRSHLPSLNEFKSTGSVTDMIVVRAYVEFDEVDPNKILELSKEICQKYGCMFNQFIIKDKNHPVHKFKKGMRDHNFSLIIFARDVSISNKPWN